MESDKVDQAKTFLEFDFPFYEDNLMEDANSCLQIVYKEKMRVSLSVVCMLTILYI